MINEFFKSIFRTLGRIAAYILLGILAYYIFSWFGGDIVKGETYDNNLYYIMTINQGYGVGNSAYNVNSINFSSTTDWGYQWRPYKSTSTYWPITKSDYMIDISWNIATSIIQTYNHLTNNLPTVYMQVQGVQATCDGNETLAVINQAQISSTYWTTYRYTCSLLNVTQDFNYFQFSSTHPLLRYGTPAFTQMSINYTSIIDKNDLSTDADAIISNNNQNTQRIIDGISGLEGNIGSVNTNIIEINDYLEDDTDANLGFFNTIIGMSPSTTPITNLITLPISILNKEIAQVQNGTCSAWTINTGTLFNNYVLTFPCINPGNYLTGYSYGGYNLWQLIDLMICLFMGYEIAMLIINSYNKILNLDDTFNEQYKGGSK